MERLLKTESRRWPVGWYHEFGLYNFAYLVGARALMAHFVPGTVTASQNALEATRHSFIEHITEEIWAQLEGATRVRRDELIHGMGGVGIVSVRSVLSGKPTGFAKCVAVSMMIHRLATQEKLQPAPFEHLSIQLAVFYIRNLKSILALVPMDVHELALELNIDARTVVDMSNGYPTTYSTADRVSEYLNSRLRNRYAAIDVYQSRVEIRDQARNHTGRGRLAPARMEKPQLENQNWLDL